MKFKVQSEKLKVKRPNLILVKILFWGIIFLAAFLRLWSLNNYPAGLNADEGAIGYNVYSLIQTGRDEHGIPWPIHFKSFGDYKPGFYFYLVLPFVKFLGLNIWSVRLPAAFLGILSVLVLMLLVKEIFEEKHLANRYSLLSGFFLAISPWHLHYSRGGWESGAAIFFILLGVWLFLKAVNHRFYFILFSVLAFVISLYTYHSARLISPLLFLGLVILFWRKIFARTNLKWIVIAALVGLIALTPLVKDFLGPAGFSRFSGVGLLSDTGPFWRTNELRGQHTNPGSLPVRLLHNRLVAYVLAFSSNWLSHFNGNFLFISGDVIERNRVPETGQMYFFDILFLISGFYFLFLHRPKNWQTILLWLGIAPIAAAMTFQTPHALRANNMVIPLVIISAYGALNIFEWFRKKTPRVFFYVLCSIFYILCSWNITRYLHQYYIHYPQTYPSAWEYGFDQLVPYLEQIKGSYDKVYVTDHYDQPYILFLFYLKYPPQDFQKEVKLTPRDQFGFSTVRDFDKFHFEKINWDELRTKSNILVVGTPGEINSSATILKRIYFKNGEVAFLVVQV